MLRRTLMALCGAIAATGAASAADLPSRAPPPVYVPPAPIFTWSGLYVGVQAGYGWGHESSTIQNPGGQQTPIPLPVAPPAANIPYTLNPQGVIGGAHVGYNLQVNQWVIGVEGNVDGTSLSQTRIVGDGSVFYTGQVKTSTPLQGSIRLRLGAAWDRWLVYATGGVAFAGVTNFYDTRVPFPVGATDQISKTRTGWTVGGGIAYAINNNWSVGVEYRYSDFGTYADQSTTGALLPLTFIRHNLTENQVQGRLTYRFYTEPPAPVVSKY
jgi:outer membrane immunogenic protein